jgi:catechol 2,3-dioxygenase-like lactoylglutathione lyase family enzyme
MNADKTKELNITGIHHVTVEVKDLEEALDFYIDILGLEELDTPDNIKEARVRWVGFPDLSALHLIENNNSTVPLLAHMALKVEDLNSWKEYLEHKGIEIKSPKLNVYTAERFFINDPSGNRIEIIKQL